MGTFWNEFEEAIKKFPSVKNHKFLILNFPGRPKEYVIELLMDRDEYDADLLMKQMNGQTDSVKGKLLLIGMKRDLKVSVNITNIGG